MRTVEQDVAFTLATFLTARQDRIACDRGVLVLHDDHGTLVASLNGADYVVTLDVSPRTA